MISSKAKKKKVRLSDNKAHLKVINQFAVGLLHQSTIDEILWSVINNAIHKLDFSDCVIYLIDETGQFLIKRAASESLGHKGITNGITQLAIGEGIVGNVAISKKARITNDTSKDKNYITDGVRRLSEITVPIVHDDILIGIIDSEHPEKDHYTEEHLQLLTTVASMAALKIVQADYLNKLVLRQNQLDLIHNNSKDLIFLVSVEPDNEFRYMSVNDAYLDLIGLSRDTVVGKTVHEIWDSERIEFFCNQYNTAIQMKCPITYEVAYERGDRLLLVETTISPIYDSAGRCIHISGISRDITQQKKTQQELIESKELFENLFEFSPNAIIIHNYEEVTSVNDAFLKLFRYDKKSDVIGKPPLETIVYEKDTKIAQYARWQSKNEAVAPIPEIRLKRGDGTIFIAEAYVTSLNINKVPHVRVTAYDITDRKQAESVLMESEKMYRSLFENSLDGIYKSTPGGKFVDVNMAMVQMLGYDSKEELLSIDINEDLYFKAGDRKVMDMSETDIFRLRKKDGSEIWVEDHGYYEYDDYGNIIFNHGILRDVTIKIEKQRELAHMFTVTADQNERLQNFAHIVSHNIRSHSSNMTSLVNFLESSRSQTEKANILDMLKTSTVKLEETIQNLNEIITINENLKKPLTELNLKQEIESTLKTLSGDIRKYDVAVSVNIDPEYKIKVIPAYLDSIVLNLTSNAIKYRSQEREPIISLDASKKGRYMVLSVSDNGLGIDLKRHGSKIFGMYKTFHDNKDSRGFGLYITKNQIEAMNGRIEVDSTVGKGTTFKAYFNDEI